MIGLAGSTLSYYSADLTLSSTDAGAWGGLGGSLAASLGHLIRKYLKTDQWTQSESTMQRESGKSVIYFMSALFSFDKVLQFKKLGHSSLLYQIIIIFILSISNILIFFS